jgi:hypothetical protein
VVFRARRPAFADAALALALALVVTVVVGVTARDVGFTRDEGYYFKAGAQAAGWFRALATSPLTALSAAGIDEHLSYNPEHPFLLKGLFGLSLAVSTALDVPVAGHTALRFPAWVIAGLAVAVVYGLGRACRLPRATSLVAAVLFASLPRVFFHMHLACFDVGVTAAHALLVLAYLSLRHTTRGALLVGAVFGVCAATKHNVLPVPALFVLHWALVELPRQRADGTIRVPVVFVALAVIGPIVYIALWPYLWPDVAGRFGAYVLFHLRHEHYPIMHAGELLSAPPFPSSFALVMWAFTIPVAVLAVCGGGAVLALVVGARAVSAAARGQNDHDATRVPLGDVVREGRGGAALLLLINAVYPVLLIALPSTPIFGGTKHWMNALPFLCVLGAWALNEAAARATGARATFLVVTVGLACCLSGVLVSARAHPAGLASYADLIGFARGAANFGQQRTFWGYEVRGALPEINARTPSGGRLHPGDVNADSHARYQKDGLLRSDIAYSPTVRGAATAHVEPQGEFKQQQIDVWNEWGTRAPAIVVEIDGVPLSTVTFKR